MSHKEYRGIKTNCKRLLSIPSFTSAHLSITCATYPTQINDTADIERPMSISAQPNAQSILIIEDDIDTCEVLELMLKRRGFETLTAFSRDEAWALVSAGCPNAVLMDYTMPGMSASVFLGRLRVICPNTRVVLVTAETNAGNVARMLNLDRYLGKPFTEDQLVSVVCGP